MEYEDACSSGGTDCDSLIPLYIPVIWEESSGSFRNADLSCRANTCCALFPFCRLGETRT